MPVWKVSVKFCLLQKAMLQKAKQTLRPVPGEEKSHLLVDAGSQMLEVMFAEKVLGILVDLVPGVVQGKVGRGA